MSPIFNDTTTNIHTPAHPYESANRSFKPGDRVKAWSSEFGTVQGEVKTGPNRNGYYGISYDNGEYRNKLSWDLTLIDPEPTVDNNTNDSKITTTYELVFSDGSVESFDNFETMVIYASGATRRGDTVDMFEVETKTERKRIDSL